MTDCNESLTDIKITEYFPASPKVVVTNGSKGKSTDKEVRFTTEDNDCSVLLTPENTPTKDQQKNTHSHIKCSPATESLDETSNTDCSLKVRKDIKFARSQSDSRLDSPKPPQAKMTRQSNEGEKGKTKKGDGKKGRGRQAKKKLQMSSQSSPTSNQSRSKSVPGNKKPESRNSLVTDFFPIRRSSRMVSSEVKKEKQKSLESAILSNCVDGLKVVEFAGKGRGVIATQLFERGDFVVEYAGDLISVSTAKKREEKYSKDSEVGCYMYYFNHGNKAYCVDGTAESGKLGRLVNHSKTKGNLATKVVAIGDRPYLILVAARNVKEGEELLYDYGDRSKSSLESHPWLAA